MILPGPILPLFYQCTSIKKTFILISNTPVMKQKPISIITALPVVHRYIVSQSMGPIIFILLHVLNLGLPIGFGWWIPSTIYHMYIIPLSLQQMVWYLLPFIWYLQMRKKSMGMWICWSIWIFISPSMIC